MGSLYFNCVSEESDGNNAECLILLWLYIIYLTYIICMLVHIYSEKLVKCYIWSIAQYAADAWTLRKLERKNLKSFEIWCGKRMEKIKWSEKVTNEQVLLRIGVKTTFLNNILRRKSIEFVISWDEIISFMMPWRTGDESERNRKKKKTAPWFEKQKKTLGANRGNWKSK